MERKDWLAYRRSVYWTWNRSYVWLGDSCGGLHGGLKPSTAMEHGEGIWQYLFNTRSCWKRFLGDYRLCFGLPTENCESKYNDFVINIWSDWKDSKVLRVEDFRARYSSEASLENWQWFAYMLESVDLIHPGEWLRRRIEWIWYVVIKSPTGVCHVY